MRRKINCIKKLKDGNGGWIEDPAAIKSHIQGYFQHLFSSELMNQNDDVINKVNPCVSHEMNEILTKPYTQEEVKKELFSIGDLKAPGSDGLHAIFFKRYWSLLGDELTDEVLRALNTGVIPEEWNDTIIVLIPKVENPEEVTKF